MICLTSFYSKIYAIKAEKEWKISKFLWTWFTACLISALYLKGHCVSVRNRSWGFGLIELYWQEVFKKTQLVAHNWLHRRQSNPLVYTVSVLVHDILSQIPLSRKDIYSRFWLVKTTVWPNTSQKQANEKRLYISNPMRLAEFETRYCALIHRRLKPLFDKNNPAAAQARPIIV